MPTQAEEHRNPQPDNGQSAKTDAVQSRVSELLDNATVIPDDDFATDALARDEQVKDGATPTTESAPTDQLENSTAGGVDPVDEPAALHDDKTGKSGKISKQGPDADGSNGTTAGDEGEQGTGDTASQPKMQSSQPEQLLPAGESSSPSTSTESADSVQSATPAATSSKKPSKRTGRKSSKKPNKEQADERVVLEDDDQMAPSVVRIRGRPGGVLVEIEDAGAWKDVLELLEERLDAAEGFFRGGKAVVEVGPRDVYEDELRQARDMLARHDMTLAVVRSTSDLTLQSSLLLGLSTSNQAERPVETDREMAPVVPITQPKSPYFVHNGTLRSGQVLRKSESIMIVGDVNPGAKVISGGDVMVWGRLRGMAYAGASGNKDARVAAIEFSPTQLRIATVTAVPPDAPKRRGLRFWRKPEAEKRPEVAHVSNGHIVVEPWDDSRPGRPRVARK